VLLGTSAAAPEDDQDDQTDGECQRVEDLLARRPGRPERPERLGSGLRGLLDGSTVVWPDDVPVAALGVLGTPAGIELLCATGRVADRRAVRALVGNVLRHVLAVVGVPGPSSGNLRNALGSRVAVAAQTNRAVVGAEALAARVGCAGGAIALGVATGSVGECSACFRAPTGRLLLGGRLLLRGCGGRDGQGLVKPYDGSFTARDVGGSEGGAL